MVPPFLKNKPQFNVAQRHQVTQTQTVGAVGAPKVASQNAIQALEPDLLQLHDTGMAVKQLQVALQGLSLYSSAIDGYFGPQTALAIKQLQNQMGLSETEAFDQATWYAISFWAKPLLGIQS